MKLAFLAATLTLTLASPAFALDGQINTHDPSTVIQCDGKYYVFGTGGGGKRADPNERPINIAINCEASAMIYHDRWYHQIERLL
jgi:hypothetical protein